VTTRRPVVLREAARRDVEGAISYYLREGASDAASSFVEKLEDTVNRIAAHPEAGSPRYAHELSLPGLRFSPITGFPHLVFYVVREEVIDVWRVLHGERDIPGWMRE